jgi:hypothetical protein
MVATRMSRELQMIADCGAPPVRLRYAGHESPREGQGWICAGRLHCMLTGTVRGEGTYAAAWCPWDSLCTKQTVRPKPTNLSAVITINWYCLISILLKMIYSICANVPAL